MRGRIPRIAVLAAAMLLLPVAAWAQDAVITGRVLSRSLAPTAGAVVAIPTLQLSAVTNDVGLYRLVVPAARVQGQQVTMVVSTLGSETQEVMISLRAGSIQRDFTLQERAIPLDQILITGTAGVMERRAQSAVIASVNAASVTNLAPIRSVSDLLQSRVAGVSLQGTSGTSGTAQTIRMRGMASISLSNEPLVFIDGIRVDSRNMQLISVGGQAGSRLNDIPPEMIESIEIVKGPAAATLYGADASAGVIQIITKRGRTGSHFSQSVTAEYHSLDANYTPPSNWGLCTAAATARNVDPKGNPLTINENPCLGQPVGTIVSDNPLVRNNSFRTGTMKSLAWSARGGGNAFNYYVSLSKDHEDGTLPNNVYGREGGQFSFDFMPRQELRIEGGLGMTRVQTDLPINDNNIYGYLGGGLLGSPVSRGAAADGWYAGNRSMAAISAIDNLTQSTRTRPRLAIHHTPWEFLTHRLVLGADLSRNDARNLFPRNDNSWYGSADLNSGQIIERRQQHDMITVDYLANISRQMNDAVRADISLGAQYLGQSTDLAGATGVGLLTNAARSIDAAARTTGEQNFTELKSAGVFGQAQFTVFDRFYPKIAARLDRHSATGRDAGLFLSPTFGISYVVSDEPAVRKVLPELISTLRLRTSYGTTGRSPSSGALQTYSAQPYLLTATQVVPGVVPGNPGNRDLKPERGQEVEAGLELGLFDERLGLEVTYFNKVSKDLVLSRPLPPSAGYQSTTMLENIGSMVNRGFEVAANAQVVSRGNFAWEQRVSFHTLHNEVTDLGEVSPFGDMNRVTLNRPSYSFHTRKIRQYDLQNNRAIVSDELEFVGNLLPGFEGNTSTSVSMLGFLRLYAQLDWKKDFYIFNSTDEFRERQFGQGERWILRDSLTHKERLQRFGPFVTESPCPGQTTGNCPISNGTVNEAYIEKGDFWRLREVSATVTLPTRFANLMRAQHASVTLAGRNLALWSEYSGADPEVNSNTSGTQRLEFLTLPPARRLVTRINLQF